MSAPSSRSFSSGVLDGDPGFDVGVLGNFQVLLRHRAFFVQYFGSLELRVRQGLVRNCRPVFGKRLRDLGALHTHQELTFGHGIADARVNLHHPAGSQRDHRNVPRYVRTHRARDVQFRSAVQLLRDGQGKALGMIHSHEARVRFALHFGGRRRLRPRIGLYLAATAGERKAHHHAAEPRRSIARSSWDDLAAHREIQLTRRGEIGTHQVQIIQLDAPVILLRLQEIEQRRAAVLISKRNRIANLHRLLQVGLLVRAQQAEIAVQRGVGRIHIAEHLG